MKRSSFLLLLGLMGLAVSSCINRQSKDSSSVEQSTGDEITVACYYFPNYHMDSRNESRYGEGWSEWELVKAAGPRFEGHDQPKVPAWGYTDEANPEHMAQKIEAASSHGLDVFIFDWYYFEDGLFLERGIEEGFFGAENNDLMEFGLMWANHNWIEIFPVDSANLLSEDGPEVLYPGIISPDTWEIMTDYIIETYFKHPSYWLIDGAPYFSIYDLSRFIGNFGDVEASHLAVEAFRSKVKKAGFTDLHLNAVVWGRTVLPSEEIIPADRTQEIVEEIGFSSTTSYVWTHHVQFDFPTHPYNDARDRYFDYAERYCSSTSLPYFPNMTMGWDSSPRTRQDEDWKHWRYPYTGILIDNSPENFKTALEKMKSFLAEQPGCNNTFLINCWNEWTEGSYLEPDLNHGMAYLEALDDVF